MAERSDIPEGEWFTNTDHELNFVIYQADGVTPEDITDWELSWRLKRKKTDADADSVLVKSTASGQGITITDGAAGKCRVVVLAAASAAIRATTYHHELKRTDTAEQSVLSYGAAPLEQSLHKTAA